MLDVDLLAYVYFAFPGTFFVKQSSHTERAGRFIGGSVGRGSCTPVP
jgi:hypothetical protein